MYATNPLSLNTCELSLDYFLSSVIALRSHKAVFHVDFTMCQCELLSQEFAWSSLSLSLYIYTTIDMYSDWWAIYFEWVGLRVIHKLILPLVLDLPDIVLQTG